MDITIPGALADFIADSNLATGADDHDPASKATREAFEAGRAGRGRTIVITPTLEVLNVISEFAETLLAFGPEATRAERRAARLWIERAGHARPRLTHSETQPDTARDAAVPEPVVVRADQVRPGDTVLATFPDDLTIDTATEKHAIYHAAPYTAEPTPYDPSCGCTACGLYRDHDEPVVTLATDTPWDTCDPAPAEAPTLIQRPAAEQPTHDEAAAEAMYAAALVTEAEATDGTWRGQWIGEQPDDALFAVERPADQGALFDDRATAPAPTVREQQRAALARIRAKADADRAAHRAATDNEIAAECAAHGVPAPRTVAARIAARTAEQAPARRVVEGVVVQHAGAATGSTPADADHPNVIAARAALDGLAAATMTDHHDVTDPTEDEQHVRGYLIDPREGDRVAVYWLEGGRIIRRDDEWHGPALDCLADRLRRRGWSVEKMLRSSQCVFAHRPVQ